MNITEETFTTWAKGPSDTEQTKSENAENAIRKAINAHQKLASMDISVFAQGSYRNKTNVKQDSDVDICVRLNSTFFDDYPAGRTREDFGNTAGSISFRDYKSLIEDALHAKFGKSSVTRGDKAFKIHENTYRIDADVVATLAYHRYRMNNDGSHYHLTGIGFDTDSGKRIINWPEQHYENGLKKHNDTGRRFRKIIRIIKRLRNRMQEEGITASNDVASCLIESLVHNVSDSGFGHDTYGDDLRYVLATIFNNTGKDEDCSEWVEVSGMKYLFRNSQPWTRDQAHTFASAAWNYIGFE